MNNPDTFTKEYGERFEDVLAELEAKCYTEESTQKNNSSVKSDKQSDGISMLLGG